MTLYAQVSAAAKKEAPVAVKTAAVEAVPLAESAKAPKAVDPVAASKTPVKVRELHQDMFLAQLQSPGVKEGRQGRRC